VRWLLLALTGLLVLVAGAVIWPRPRVAGTPDPARALEASTRVPVAVRDVLHRACFDCHSNQTRWPWYAGLPPAAWLVNHDVRAARGQINFSEWRQYDLYDRADMLDKMCDVVTRRQMPPLPYRLLHPEARLSPDDAKAICGWTRAEGDRLVQGGP
jgi:hypothetical protein